MDTQILNGLPVSKAIKKSLVVHVDELAQQNIIPALAAILVGNDSASQVYIQNKQSAFEKLNCYSKT